MIDTIAGAAPPPREHWKQRGRVKVDGAAVRAAMRQRGYTTTTLGAELGTSSRTVERICKGTSDPTREQVLLLLELLPIPPDRLLLGSAPPPLSDP